MNSTSISLRILTAMATVVTVGFGLSTTTALPVQGQDLVGSPGAAAATKAKAVSDSSLSVTQGKEKLPVLLPPMKAQLDTGNSQSQAKSSAKAAACASGSPKNSDAFQSAKNISLAKEYLKHGAKMHGQGNIHMAESFFNKAINLDPHNPDGYFNLGALYEGRGELSMALQHYKLGLRVKPDDLEMREAVASLEGKLGRSGSSDSARISRVDQGTGYGSDTDRDPVSDPGSIPFAPSISSLPSSMDPVSSISNDPALTAQAPDSGVTPTPTPIPTPTPAPSTGIPGQSSARMRGILGTILRQGINMGIRAALRSAGGSFGF
ncbi:tetratricopeptide repeat protein [bacterium]|nr:tetratricopeptide repeat protein [bacterium]